MSCTRRLAVAAALLAAVGAHAQTPPVHIRGTIRDASAGTLSVITREGPVVDVALSPQLVVATLRRLDLSAITKGSYVGVTAVPGPDDTLVARAVTVFPEAQRGVGEGHRPWDLSPGSTMTNADVDAVVQTADGRDLTLAYKGGSVRVHVPQDAPVVTYDPGTRADLRSGERVYVNATRTDQGGYVANRVLVGKNGVVPSL